MLLSAIRCVRSLAQTQVIFLCEIDGGRHQGEREMLPHKKLLRTEAIKSEKFEENGLRNELSAYFFVLYIAKKYKK